MLAARTAARASRLSASAESLCAWSEATSTFMVTLVHQVAVTSTHSYHERVVAETVLYTEVNPFDDQVLYNVRALVKGSQHQGSGLCQPFTSSIILLQSIKVSTVLRTRSPLPA
ncbi:unnamed protein product [Sphagnum jensenii]|uniref:Uncharacterized protein n=1 Tax=Sphagnum jensenii TaxID=128206 RepID=A0ABP0VEM7_9BRYO